MPRGLHPHREPPVGAVRIREAVAHAQTIHAGTWRPFPQRSQESLLAGGGYARKDFHPPPGEVTHPPGHTHLGRHATGVIAKTHALHESLDDDVSCRLHAPVDLSYSALLQRGYRRPARRMRQYST